MRFWLGASFAAADEYVPLARAADRLGYDTVTLSDHIFYADYEAKYPYTETGAPPYEPETHWPDVWVTIGAMAAVTERVKFAPNVYIPVARDFFTVAKAVSTAAYLSNDRVRFAAGVGWCKDEFVQTGQDFHTRGRRFDEMIPALQEVWRGGDVEHHGEFFDFGPLRIAPVPRAPVPVYIGGESDHALRRAARIGDGWIGNRVFSEDDLEILLARIEGFLAERGRSLDGFDVVAPMGVMPSADVYRKWRDRGITSTMAAPWYTATREERARFRDDPLGLKLATMERFAEEVIAKV